MRSFWLSLVLVSTFTPAVAAGESANWNTDADGLLLEGFDLVSYFHPEGPLEGVPQFQIRYQGATLYFANSENLRAFEENPSEYFPKYGGYCAYGVALFRDLYPVNPKSFEIVDGDLLLFFHDDFQGEPYDAKARWNADTRDLGELADEVWASRGDRGSAPPED